MTRANELEKVLADAQRSWARIPPLIRRTLFFAMMNQHNNVIDYIVEEFSERIGIKTADSRIIPATTGGISPHFYENISSIHENKKDEAYLVMLNEILEKTYTPRRAMLIGMQYQLFRDYHLDEIKSGDEYLRTEIEFEMRNGDGSYHRHLSKLYAEQIVQQALQLSRIGKEKLMEVYSKQTGKHLELEQPLLILPGQMPSRYPQQVQRPREQTKSGLIIASLDDVRKFGK